MVIISRILLAVLATMLLHGCQGINKQGGGALIGGATGALLGSQFGKGSGQVLATGVGALAGALVGGQIGKSLDQYDKQLLSKTTQRALEVSPSGNGVEWRNPDSQNHGTVTPIKTFRDTGRYCREYVQEVIIGGQKQKAYGKACRAPDGQWEILR